MGVFTASPSPRDPGLCMVYLSLHTTRCCSFLLHKTSERQECTKAPQPDVVQQAKFCVPHRPEFIISKMRNPSIPPSLPAPSNLPHAAHLCLPPADPNSNPTSPRPWGLDLERFWRQAGCSSRPKASQPLETQRRWRLRGAADVIIAPAITAAIAVPVWMAHVVWKLDIP